MKNCKLSAAAKNAATEAVTAMLNGGYIDLYAGPQPAEPGERAKSQVRLLRIPLSDPAFTPATEGRAEVFRSWESNPAEATGKIEWFRAYRYDGVVVMDGSVGTSGSDMNLNDVDIRTGTVIFMKAFRFAALG